MEPVGVAQRCQYRRRLPISIVAAGGGLRYYRPGPRRKAAPACNRRTALVCSPVGRSSMLCFPDLEWYRGRAVGLHEQRRQEIHHWRAPGALSATCPYLPMKNSLSLVVSLVALLAVMSGCNTLRIGDRSVGSFPQNTLVIRNRTSYTLDVWRNGVVWEHPETRKGLTYQIPVEVGPRAGTCALQRCAPRARTHPARPVC